MSYDGPEQASRRATMKAHRIVDVAFQRMKDEGRPMTEAPITCTCGAHVTSGTWDVHRGAHLDTDDRV